jgi:hypothetical protein
MPRAAVLLCLLLTRAASGAGEAAPEAKAFYREGESRYEAGDFDGAAELFAKAYALSHAPGLLFNLAQSYRLAGPARCVEARETYRRCLEADPHAPNRQEVEERLQALSSCVAAAPEPAPPESVAASPSPAGAPTAEASVSTPRRTPWAGRVVLIAGSAIAAGGAVLYGAAYVNFQQAKAVCHPCVPGTYSGWQYATDASYGLLIAGAVTVAIGALVWWLTSEAAATPAAP